MEHFPQVLEMVSTSSAGVRATFFPYQVLGNPLAASLCVHLCGLRSACYGIHRYTGCKLLQTEAGLITNTYLPG